MFADVVVVVVVVVVDVFVQDGSGILFHLSEMRAINNQLQFGFCRSGLSPSKIGRHLCCTLNLESLVNCTLKLALLCESASSRLMRVLRPDARLPKSRAGGQGQ